GELGDVVGGRVGLESAELAEVVDRVAGVARGAAHAEDEQPATALPDPGETRHQPLDLAAVERTHDGLGLRQGPVAEGAQCWCPGGPGWRHLAKVLRPNLWRKQSMSRGRNPAFTRRGQRSRGS